MPRRPNSKGYAAATTKGGDSNGNDMIVAKKGIGSIKALKGKKVGLETGLVEHLMLTKALEKNGLKITDVKLVNYDRDFATKERDRLLKAWQTATSR